MSKSPTKTPTERCGACVMNRIDENFIPANDSPSRFSAFHLSRELLKARAAGRLSIFKSARLQKYGEVFIYMGTSIVSRTAKYQRQNRLSVIEQHRRNNSFRSPVYFGSSTINTRCLLVTIIDYKSLSSCEESSFEKYIKD